MDKKEIILLFSKIVEKKLNEFYENKIKPDIEKMIGNTEKKEDVKVPILNDQSKPTVSSLLSIMEDDDLDDNIVQKTMSDFSIKKNTFVENQQKNKKELNFNTKNPQLNKILSEMSADPSQYRIPRENESSLVMMDGAFKSNVGDYFGTLNYNSDMISPNNNTISQDSGYSLEDVKFAVAQQTGNSDIANRLIRDYSSILKKSKEKGGN